MLVANMPKANVFNTVGERTLKFLNKLNPAAPPMIPAANSPIPAAEFNGFIAVIIWKTITMITPKQMKQAQQFNNISQAFFV